jgi:hypothetical protein
VRRGVRARSAGRGQFSRRRRRPRPRRSPPNPRPPERSRRARRRASPEPRGRRALGVPDASRPSATTGRRAAELVAAATRRNATRVDHVLEVADGEVVQRWNDRPGQYPGPGQAAVGSPPARGDDWHVMHVGPPFPSDGWQSHRCQVRQHWASRLRRPGARDEWVACASRAARSDPVVDHNMVGPGCAGRWRPRVGGTPSAEPAMAGARGPAPAQIWRLWPWRSGRLRCWAGGSVSASCRGSPARWPQVQ